MSTLPTLIKGNTDSAIKLINKSANINAKSSFNKTPLDLAENEAIKDLLISHGAKEGSELN